MKEKVSIVIVHFGDISTTINCLKNIKEKVNDYYRIYILNNNTKKISINRIHLKKVLVIDNYENLGFASAVNIGIKKAITDGATFVLLLNNDTLVEQLNFHQMINNSPKNSIIGPVIKYKKNKKTVFDLGGKLNKIWGRTSHFEVNRIPEESSLLRDYVSGCCMLIPIKVIKKIGYFSENYFLYYEDVEFCLRAQEKGFYTYVNTKNLIFHLVSASTSKNKEFAVFHQARSAIIFGLKNLNFPIFNTIFVIIQSFLFFVKNKNLGKSAFSGIKDGYMFMGRNLKYYSK